MPLYARDVGSEFDVQMLQTRRHIPRSHRDIAGHIFRTGVAAHAVVRVEISTQALIAALAADATAALCCSRVRDTIRGIAIGRDGWRDRHVSGAIIPNRVACNLSRHSGAGCSCLLDDDGIGDVDAARFLQRHAVWNLHRNRGRNASGHKRSHRRIPNRKAGPRFKSHITFNSRGCRDRSKRGIVFLGHYQSDCRRLWNLGLGFSCNLRRSTVDDRSCPNYQVECGRQAREHV